MYVSVYNPAIMHRHIKNVTLRPLSEVRTETLRVNRTRLYITTLPTYLHCFPCCPFFASNKRAYLGEDGIITLYLEYGLGTYQCYLNEPGSERGEVRRSGNPAREWECLFAGFVGLHDLIK